jgi:3-hydroxy-3-methylglutaryl CoA synthase/uncharacterized OB-fold protein
MSGISAFGAYIPSSRLPVGKGERAVASHDEDAVTMAVAAAQNALGELDRSAVDGVFFASTSAPYAEKQSAALIAQVLDLRRNIITTDFGGSLRAGVLALQSALDAVRAGSVTRALVLASDCRMAPPRTPLEGQLADAACAFIVDQEAAVARFESAHHFANEMLDVWRTDGDRFVRTWEERFIVDHGYRQNMLALRPMMKDIARAALSGPDARAHAALCKALELGPAQIVDPLFSRLGNAGCAFAPLLLAHALEAAKDERVLLASYGDGASALIFSASAHRRPPRRTVEPQLARSRKLDYETHRRARHLEVGSDSASSGISATMHWRDREQDLALKAERCLKCGTLQFPRHRVCFRCRAQEFELQRLSDRRGKVMSFTFDHFHPSAESPTVAGVVEVDGCRLYLMMTDCKPDELRVDLPVELTFRRIHEVGQKPNYFWKSTPVRDA